MTLGDDQTIVPDRRGAVPAAATAESSSSSSSSGSGSGACSQTQSLRRSESRPISRRYRTQRGEPDHRPHTCLSSEQDAIAAYSVRASEPTNDRQFSNRCAYKFVDGRRQIYPGGRRTADGPPGRWRRRQRRLRRRRRRRVAADWVVDRTTGRASTHSSLTTTTTRS